MKTLSGTDILVSMAWVLLATIVRDAIQEVVAVMELAISVRVVAVVQVGYSPSRATETGREKTILMPSSLL